MRLITLSSDISAMLLIEIQALISKTDTSIWSNSHLHGKTTVEKCEPGNKFIAIGFKDGRHCRWIQLFAMPSELGNELDGEIAGSFASMKTV